MADEVKQEEKKEEKKVDMKKVMSTIFKVLLGVAFLILGVLAILRWWMHLKVVVLGCIGLFLILAGLITLAIAKE